MLRDLSCQINIEAIGGVSLWFLILVFPVDKLLMISTTGIGAYFGAQCEKQGMLVRVAGDNIMMSPSFIITPEEVDEVSLTILLVSAELSRNSMSIFLQFPCRDFPAVIFRGCLSGIYFM